MSLLSHWATNYLERRGNIVLDTKSVHDLEKELNRLWGEDLSKPEPLARYLLREARALVLATL